MVGGIALIGSGELSDSMAETHRALMSHLGEPCRPVFVDSMAGFELNVEQIGQKAASYFKRHFNLPLAVARYRRASDDPAAAVTAIMRANYILAGPGSPSYGIRVWRDSQVWQAIRTRWQQGALIVFASAAAITLGALALPVYEIYKVGEAAHWIPGLDLLSALGLNAAVVPHWNNGSGSHHDTRFCFMGAPRLAELEHQKPPETLIIGIDEYTALYIDSPQGSGAPHAQVYGAGTVVFRREGHELRFGRGQIVDLGQLSMGDAAPIMPLDDLPPPENAADADDADDNAARSAVERDALLESLLDLVVMARAELRKAKLWAAADALRERLTELGYTLSDTPQGSTWQRTERAEA